MCDKSLIVADWLRMYHTDRCTKWTFITFGHVDSRPDATGTHHCEPDNRIPMQFGGVGTAVRRHPIPRRSYDPPVRGWV